MRNADDVVLHPPVKGAFLVGESPPCDFHVDDCGIEVCKKGGKGADVWLVNANVLTIKEAAQDDVVHGVRDSSRWRRLLHAFMEAG